VHVMALQFPIVPVFDPAAPSATGRLCSSSFTRLWLSIEGAFCPDIGVTASNYPMHKIAQIM
jgi:hypothetical protein